MNTRFNIAIVFVLCATLCCAVPGRAQEPRKPSPRWSVTLVDGSRFFGTPSFTSIPLHTDYGKLVIPLEKVKRIAFAGNRETATVYFENRDTIAGVLELKEFLFTTVLGKLNLPPAQVQELAVTTTAAVPDISGNWLDAAGGRCRIAQEEDSITFIAANGATSKGIFKDGKTVWAPPAPGWVGHTGEVVEGGKRIQWTHAEGATWWVKAE